MCVVLLALLLIPVALVVGWREGRRATRREIAELVGAAALLANTREER